MEAAPAHAVPAGPLGVRWLAYELEPLQAGALAHARVELENAGAAAWHEVLASYHWLDDLGNPILWDGLRTPLPALAPGERTTAALDVRAVMPPGRYRLAFDLVLEHRYWLSEIGNELLEVEVEVDRARWLRSGRAPPARGRACGGLARARPRRPRRGLRRGRRRDREPPARAPRLSPGRRAQPVVSGAARLPVAVAATRAELRGGRAPGLAARRPGALDLRRTDRRPAAALTAVSETFGLRDSTGSRSPRHSSTAIRSSTRRNTHAPSASATTASTQR